MRAKLRVYLWAALLVFACLRLPGVFSAAAGQGKNASFSDIQSLSQSMSPLAARLAAQNALFKGIV
jgi:hypothetical protein